MAEEEKKTNDIMSVRETILSKYRQTGLSTKDAEEKTDSFIREQLFRPREGGVDLQMAGLLARFADIERQQAEKISSAEKTAENVKEAPVQQAENVNEAAARQAENESEAQVRQPERKVPNEVTVNRYAADLKDITGADWAFKDAEHSGLKINNLSVASTPELLDKLEKRHIRYFPINKNGEKYVAVDTDQELHLTNDEINKASDRYEHDILKKFQTRAEQLKQITGKDWADNDKDNRIASSPELLATLEGKNVRYKSVKEGDQEFLSVDKDDFICKLLKVTRDMRGQKDRMVLFHNKFPEDIYHLVSYDRIESAGGFIHDKKLCMMRKSHGNLKLHPHTSGKSTAFLL